MRAICCIKGNNIFGEIIFEETGSGVRMHGNIRGLSPGKHGFHIHNFGAISGCNTVGKHFNPYNKNHGAPYSIEKHLGDLGNIIVNENGMAIVDEYYNFLTLSGNDSIMGRSLVIHSNEDDLGKGNNQESKISGNSGTKIACGNILAY
ncbi:superoxide dismutase [Alphaentomopoxvirus acuprea]|uniref:Superoxide dismutase n=1 Tax=Alphaentomopoxvirus acuprea TaxID=62099 RepID=W6JIT4_9POXV|nr:superoxide dismutase precursor [Anomala cuprea entomopoxvirus]BAO49452.1 superoxide dismutase [Anomala cuprea entomopoxvirus]